MWVKGQSFEFTLKYLKISVWFDKEIESSTSFGVCVGRFDGGTGKPYKVGSDFPEHTCSLEVD